MIGFFTCVKGVSGSGKSTRILQLILFFRNVLNYTFEDVLFNNKKVGFLIKEINTIYLGRLYFTEGIERLQGFDAVTNAFGTSENASNFVKEKLTQYNIIVEGAGITQTFRNRPQFIWEYLQAKKIYIQYYNYNNYELEDYKKRIMYRSGKLPKKMTMWTKNKSFITDYSFSIIEKEEILKHCEIDIDLVNDNFDSLLEDFGVKYLSKIEKSEYIDQYKKYCIDHDYTKVNSFEVFQSKVKPKRTLF